MTHTITVGRGQYHQHQEMVDWCRATIGPGKWVSGVMKTWKGFDDLFWTIDSFSGYTTFTFRNKKHLTWFILRWT